MKWFLSTFSFWRELASEIRIWWIFRKTCRQKDNLQKINNEDLRVDWLGRMYGVINMPEEVFKVTKKNCRLRVKKQLRKQHIESDLWLAFAPLKKTKTDFVIEKTWKTKNPFEVEQKIFKSLENTWKKNEKGEFDRSLGKCYRNSKFINGKRFYEFVDGATLKFFCERIEEFIQK